MKEERTSATQMEMDSWWWNDHSTLSKWKFEGGAQGSLISVWSCQMRMPGSCASVAAILPSPGSRNTLRKKSCVRHSCSRCV